MIEHDGKGKANGSSRSSAAHQSMATYFPLEHLVYFICVPVPVSLAMLLDVPWNLVSSANNLHVLYCN